jgi:hypothetical protein
MGSRPDPRAPLMSMAVACSVELKKIGIFTNSDQQVQVLSHIYTAASYLYTCGSLTKDFGRVYLNFTKKQLLSGYVEKYMFRY